MYTLNINIEVAGRKIYRVMEMCWRDFKKMCHQKRRVLLRRPDAESRDHKEKIQEERKGCSQQPESAKGSCPSPRKHKALKRVYKNKKAVKELRDSDTEMMMTDSKIP